MEAPSVGNLDKEKLSKANLLITWMFCDEFSDPRCRCVKFPSRSSLNELQILLNCTMCVRINIHSAQIIINQSD